jgi:hypothetical protein
MIQITFEATEYRTGATARRHNSARPLWRHCRSLACRSDIAPDRAIFARRRRRTVYLYSFSTSCLAVGPETLASCLPVVGDWNGDGRDTPGVLRPSAGTWILTNSAPRRRHHQPHQIQVRRRVLPACGWKLGRMRRNSLWQLRNLDTFFVRAQWEGARRVLQKDAGHDHVFVTV